MRLAHLRCALAGLLAAASVPVSAMAQDNDSRGDIYSLVAVTYDIPAGNEIAVSDETVAVEADLDLDNGLGVMTALGWYISESMRVEAEFGYRAFDLTGISRGGSTVLVEGEIKTTSLMVNGFTPVWGGNYAGLGVGFARHDLTIGIGDVIGIGEDTVFAYQAIFGTDYPLANAIRLWVGVRYFATADADFGTTNLAISHSHVGLETGLRF